MSNIRVRKETGCLFLDFYAYGVRCREQTELIDNRANRKLLSKLEENVKSALADGTYRHKDFFPSSKRIQEVETARILTSPSHSTQSSQVPITPTHNPNTKLQSNFLTILFSDFANQWYSEMEVGWKRSHRTTTRGILDNVLIPEFGNKQVHEIKKADILSFRSTLAKTPGVKNKDSLSASRINHVMTPLRMILTEASDRYTFSPAFINIKPLKVGKTDVQPFTIDEVQDIIRTVRSDFRNYYIVRFFTGMRTGEIDGLKWQYVDFERRTISIKETIVNSYEETPKTGESERDIQMSQMVFDALLAQHKVTGHFTYVFSTSADTPIAHRNISKRVWYPLLRLLGLKKRIPYQTRHTYATLMLASGEAPEWIARQMGHSTTEMLFRVYSRFIPNLTRQDGSAFERLMAAQMQSLPHPVVHPENMPSFEGLPKTQRNIQPLVNKSNSAVKEDFSSETVPTQKTLPSEQPLSVNKQFQKTQVNLSPISDHKDNPWLAIAKHAGLIQPVAENQIQASRLQEGNQ